MSDISSTDCRSHTGAKSSLLSAATGIQPHQLIRCDIVFGMPSQDCRGTGICKLTSDLDMPPAMKKECRHTVAFAGRSEDGLKVSFLFFRELLCVDLFRRQFRNGIFDMPEACLLPDSIAEKLEMNGRKLLPGQYAVQMTGNCFKVDILCE